MRYPLPQGSIIPASSSLREGAVGGEKGSRNTRLTVLDWWVWRHRYRHSRLFCSIDLSAICRNSLSQLDFSLSLAEMARPLLGHSTPRAWEGLWTAGLRWTDMHHQRSQTIRPGDFHRRVPQPHCLLWDMCLWVHGSSSVDGDASQTHAHPCTYTSTWTPPGHCSALSSFYSWGCQYLSPGPGYRHRFKGLVLASWTKRGQFFAF